jgi:hypothetical protein
MFLLHIHGKRLLVGIRNMVRHARVDLKFQFMFVPGDVISFYLGNKPAIGKAAISSSIL